MKIRALKSVNGKYVMLWTKESCSLQVLLVMDTLCDLPKLPFSSNKSNLLVSRFVYMPLVDSSMHSIAFERTDREEFRKSDVSLL